MFLRCYHSKLTRKNSKQSFYCILLTFQKTTVSCFQVNKVSLKLCTRVLSCFKELVYILWCQMTFNKKVTWGVVKTVLLQKCHLLALLSSSLVLKYFQNCWVFVLFLFFFTFDSNISIDKQTWIKVGKGQVYCSLLLHTTAFLVLTRTLEKHRTMLDLMLCRLLICRRVLLPDWKSNCAEGTVKRLSQSERRRPCKTSWTLCRRNFTAFPRESMKE